MEVEVKGVKSPVGVVGVRKFGDWTFHWQITTFLGFGFLIYNIYYNSYPKYPTECEDQKVMMKIF